MVRLAAHYSTEFYLLWGNIKTDRPEVHLPVVVHTGNNEEDPGALRSSFPQPAQSEDDGSLVFLHHLREHSQKNWGKYGNFDLNLMQNP